MDAATAPPEDANVDYALVLPGPRRQFAMVGDLGQRIIIDPASKLIMVNTALDEKAGASWALWRKLVEQFGM